MNRNSSSFESCKFWHYDDVTPCGRVTYLNFYVPLTVLAFFGAFTGYKTMRHIYRLNYLREKKLNFANEVTTASHADENKPLLSDASGAVYTDPDLVSHETSLKEEHFSIEKLRLVDTDGTPHGLVEVVKRGFVEKTRVVLEFLLVLAQFAIHTFVWAKLA